LIQRKKPKKNQGKSDRSAHFARPRANPYLTAVSIPWEKGACAFVGVITNEEYSGKPFAGDNTREGGWFLRSCMMLSISETILSVKLLCKRKRLHNTCITITKADAHVEETNN
jgi:hypothetical protein